MKIDKRMLENLPARMQKDKTIPEGWVYVGNEYERYILGQPGKLNMLVFGVNPSTASPGEDNIDQTIRTVRRLTEEAGCDGWLMVNLYPLRATNPDELPEEANKVLLRNNLKVIKAVAETYPIYRIWAAWGNTIDKRFYLGEALYEIQDALNGDYSWYYRGQLTKDGNPRHPLYMKKGEDFNSFPVFDYASEWHVR